MMSVLSLIFVSAWHGHTACGAGSVEPMSRFAPTAVFQPHAVDAKSQPRYTRRLPRGGSTRSAARQGLTGLPHRIAVQWCRWIARSDC